MKKRQLKVFWRLMGFISLTGSGKALSEACPELRLERLFCLSRA